MDDINIPAQIFDIKEIYYNCLSPTNTRSEYSSMSVSIVYGANKHKRYNMRCTDGVWKIVETELTVLKNNNTRYCDDCTNRTVNEYHCTG